MSQTTDTILAAIAQIMPVVATVTGVMAPEAAPVIGVAMKIAQGVAAAVPEAEALYEQFQNGNIPSQAELDAYAIAEDGAYAKLMADIQAKQAT